MYQGLPPLAGGSTLTGQCAKCGSCTQVCPVYLETGRESDCARGKLHLAAGKLEYNSTYLSSILAQCLQCGACDAICPRGIEPCKTIRALRHGQSIGQTKKGALSFITRSILNNRTLLALTSPTLNLLQKLPAASGLRNKLNHLPQRPSSVIPSPKSEATTTLAYFPGCLAHHVQTDIEQATRYLASLCGYTLHIPAKASCCGVASASSGNDNEARNQALKNITAYAQTTGPILTSCGSCYASLKGYPDLFSPDSDHHTEARTFASRVQEIASFFLKEDGLHSLDKPQQVFYHDPCHLRFLDRPIMIQPRELIRNLNGIDVVNKEHPLGCCGQGGLFSLVNPPLADAIFSRVKDQLTPSRQTIVVTSCSSCLTGLQQGLANMEITVQHLCVFLAKRCTSC